MMNPGKRRKLVKVYGRPDPAMEMKRMSEVLDTVTAIERPKFARIGQFNVVWFNK